MGGCVAIISLKSMILKFKDEPMSKKIWKYPVLWIFIMLKRYVRIIPFVALVNWYSNGIQNYIYPDTVISMGAISCDKLGWESWILFYIWGESSPNICAGWLWYLYIDYCCYILVPLIMMGYSYKKSLGYLLAFIPFCGSIIYSMILSIKS